MCRSAFGSPVAVVALVAVVSACERPTPMESAANQSRQRPASLDMFATSAGMPARSRFTLDVTATGSLTPGSQVTLLVRGTVHVGAQTVQLRVSMPEVEAARLADWRAEEYYLDPGRPVPSLYSRVLSPSSGQSVAEDIPISIPVAGYYRVVASLVVQSNEPAVVDRHLVSDVAHAEGWLWIGDSGGQFTHTFDPTVFPSSVRPVPGPLRHRSTGPGRTQPSWSASFANSSSTVITYRVLYYDYDDSTYVALSDMLVDVDYCELPETQIICEPWDFQPLATTSTDEYGYASFPCEGDEYEGYSVTWNSVIDLTAPGNSVGFGGDPGDDCGQSFDVVIGSGSAHSFWTFMKVDAESRALFGAGRSAQLEVEHKSTGNDTLSYYLLGSDKIVVITKPSTPEQVWGMFGAFTHGHEYGHAVQAGALGATWSNICPDGREIDAETDLGCAFFEGFATYHAVATRPDLGSEYTYRTSVGSNSWLQSGDDGAIVEGAVAAFLLDVTNGALEAHDSVAAPGSYMAAVIATCEVYAGSSWTRADGIDHVV